MLRSDDVDSCCDEAQLCDPEWDFALVSSVTGRATAGGCMLAYKSSMKCSLTDMCVMVN